MYEHNALGYWSGLALCLTKSEAVEHAVLRQLLLNFKSYVLLEQNTHCVDYKHVFFRTTNLIIKKIHVTSPG